MGAQRIITMRAACTIALVVLAFAQIELASAKHHISELKRFQRHVIPFGPGLRRNQGSGTTSGTASGQTSAPTGAPTSAPTENLPIATTIKQTLSFKTIAVADYTGAVKTLAEASYGVTLGIAVVKKVTSRRTGAEFKAGCSVSSSATAATTGCDVAMTAKVTSTHATTAKANSQKSSTDLVKELVANMAAVKAADPTRYANVQVPSASDVSSQTPVIQDEVVSGTSSVSASILVAFGLAAVAMHAQW